MTVEGFKDSFKFVFGAKARALLRRSMSRVRSLRPQPAYDSFQHALADSHTYEDSELVDLVARKTEVWNKSQTNVVADRQTTQNLLVLSAIQPDRPLDLLEVGGACGATFLSLNHLLPGRIATWRIVETPAMAEAGERLALSNQLSFSRNLVAANAAMGRRDLLFAQGVLQYMPDPVRAFGDLLALGFDNVYVSRTLVGVGLERPVITKQVVSLSEHGPTVALAGMAQRKTSQPLTIVPAEYLERVRPNYRAVLAFAEGADRVVLVGWKRVVTRTIGFLLTRTAL